MSGKIRGCLRARSPRGIGDTLQVFLPRMGVLGHEIVIEETVDELVNHGLEKVRAPGDVPIQCHRLYVQGRSEATHRELAETAGVDEARSPTRRPVHDQVAAEPRARPFLVGDVSDRADFTVSLPA